MYFLLIYVRIVPTAHLGIEKQINFEINENVRRREDICHGQAGRSATRNSWQDHNQVELHMFCIAVDKCDKLIFQI